MLRILLNSKKIISGYIILIGLKSFIIFPYHYLNVCRVCRGVPSTIFDMGHLCLLFSMISLVRGLSVILLFQKNQLMVFIDFLYFYVFYFVDVCFLFFHFFSFFWCNSFFFFQFLKLYAEVIVFLLLMQAFSIINFPLRKTLTTPPQFYMYILFHFYPVQNTL